MTIYRHSVYWGNPYTSPPNEMPRVLVVEHSPNHRPSERFFQKATRIIDRLCSKGIWSYSFGWSWEDDPNKIKKTWSWEAKVKNRRRRLRKRLEKKYSIPFLLESAYESAIADNPTYFGS